MKQEDTMDGAEIRLAEKEYRLLLAQPLAAAAETAAERGDPHLFNDMASMLALMHTVRSLAGHYRREVPADEWDSREAALEAAGLGACALVFTESELSREEVDECLGALHQAAGMLDADRVLSVADEDIAAAWNALQRSQYEPALERLQKACAGIAEAIDRWESERR